MNGNRNLYFNVKCYDRRYLPLLATNVSGQIMHRIRYILQNVQTLVSEKICKMKGNLKNFHTKIKL